MGRQSRLLSRRSATKHPMSATIQSLVSTLHTSICKYYTGTVKRSKFCTESRMGASAENEIVRAVEVPCLAWSFNFNDHWINMCQPTYTQRINGIFRCSRLLVTGSPCMNTGASESGPRVG
ncbi:hypothetical protein HBI25_162280 [Parastagonospora nodorum]|nr:hypothetical protein HBH54_018730 [Parastagonospora nodorum]KAH3969213.1 hypothetical protein HBH51_123300 [Parastagonospora nodorum]KAH4006917.1 hypothetical protein HBI10_018570 [Parastagonospora nodorum]KAH4075008.1 hypothetical protein HBH50_032700 [Parastagonospora nodorum]KAH4097067.1 hypothetical protein HBH48_041580 [Parastagonospora nodorum]